jgi:hypothetical protein
MDLADFLGETCEGGWVEAELLPAGESFAAELEQDPLVTQGG